MLPKLQLPDLLAHLSEQLVAVDRAARERGQPIMQFEECEVELAVKLEVGVQGGVKFWVMELGTKAKTEHSNKIKVKFKPLAGTTLQAVQTSSAAPAPGVTRQTKRQTG